LRHYSPHQLNVFIYSYNRKTHSTYSALQLTGVQKNVFIYSYHIEPHSSHTVQQAINSVVL